jgi:hypothetical protein
MSKELKNISPGSSSNELATVIGDFKAVKAINGHIPDDAEIREELLAVGLAATEYHVQLVRAAIEK